MQKQSVHQLKKLGLLGGGQLAWMLQMKSQSLGLPTYVLCPKSDEPAAQTNPQWVKGHSDSKEDLMSFAKSVDIITFESEFYDATQLQLGLKSYKGDIFPPLNSLRVLQDRLTQKQSLAENHLPTSPFTVSDDAQQIYQFFHTHNKIVAKQRRNAYDGYGTFVIKTEEMLKSFLQDKASSLNDFLFEKFIPFEKEMAVQVARSRKGDIQFFPFVTTVQKDNKCFYVVGPEKPPQKQYALIKKWLNKINYVGVMGIEFFKTANGELIINEVAPRVHNTGHHTLDSCTVDQFTMHWLCILQDKLPTPELKSPAFVMLNLIGNSDYPVQFPNEINGALYWYRKSNRKGRKLGHINWVGKNKRALVLKALRYLKQWKF